MTRGQQQRLAQKLIDKASEIVEFYEEVCPDLKAEGVSWQQAAQQLSNWLQKLPGDGWNQLLPQPKNSK